MMQVILLYMVIGGSGASEEFYFHGTAFSSYLGCIEYYNEYKQALDAGIERFGKQHFKTQDVTIEDIGCVTQRMSPNGTAVFDDHRSILP